MIQNFTLDYLYFGSQYTLEELNSMNDSSIDYILSTIDYLIDGRFELGRGVRKVFVDSAF